MVKNDHTSSTPTEAQEQAKQAIIKLIEGIIGEDEKLISRRLTSNSVFEQMDESHKSERNILRAEQRTALSKLIGDKENT